MSVLDRLILAMYKNDMLKVKTLLQHPDLNINDKDYIHDEYPLCAAVMCNNQMMLATILAVPGLNVNTWTNFGTALSLACWHGKLTCVEQLLAMPNIDINMPDCANDTPLSDALARGHMECAALMLQRPEIDINCRNLNGQTALWRAASINQCPAIVALLARPDLDHVHVQATMTLSLNKQPYSALDIARQRHNHMSEVLLTPAPFWRLYNLRGMVLYPLRLMMQVGLSWQLVLPVSSLLWSSLPMELITLVLTHLATDLTWP